MKDINVVVEIYRQGWISLRERNIPQWGKGYPGFVEARRDINAGVCYVVEDEGKVCGVASILLQDDPDYASIDGAWLNEEPYAVIHRIAVLHEGKNRGYAGDLISFAGTWALQNGRKNLRIDTHDLNVPMKSFLQKCGFVYCGVIVLSKDSTLRNGYQKVLS